MIELLILYILSKRENTMYGTLKSITDEFGAYTAPSFGAIKPALTRLESDNSVKVRKSISDGGKISGFYAITQSGREKLKQLLLEPISENPLQFSSVAKIKLSCINYLSSDERKKIFFEVKSKAQNHKITAEKILENNSNHLNFYQRILLDNTIHEYKNFITIIESLEKENAGNS